MRKLRIFLLSMSMWLTPAVFAQSENCVIDFSHNLLDTLAHMSDQEGLAYLSRKGITLELDGKRVQKPSNINIGTQEISTYSIQREDGVYQMELTTQNSTQLQLRFPADRELIQGTDKATADSLISQQLQSNTNCEPKPYERMYVPKPMNNGLYLHRGDWFLSPKLRTDVYLTLKNGTFLPVFEKKYQDESFLNMLQGVTHNQVKLNVHHHQYANRINVFETPLNCLLDILREGAVPYVACEQNKKGLMGYVFIYNESLNYMHLLTVELTDECFSGKVTLNAHLYTHIPQQNFQDYKLLNN